MLSRTDLGRLAQVNKQLNHRIENIKEKIALDISCGCEQVPVPCSNFQPEDPEKFPPLFEYITKRQLYRSSDSHCYEGCVCTEDCLLSPIESCLCLSRMKERAYNSRGQLIKLIEHQMHCESEAPIIFECNDRCNCPPQCSNRVIQHGMALNLEIVKTAKKGWGVVTRQHIAKGTFVCEYIGEVISTSEAKRRMEIYDKQNKNYLLIIREFIAARQMILRTNIDATRQGNVARFLNHSCDPNLALFLVRIHSVVPHVVFFASRDIVAGEELTFHYGVYNQQRQYDQATEQKGKTNVENFKQLRPCHCGSQNCCGFLPFDATV
jgi:histone-lysine N-methyltransferase SETMAR